MSTKKIRLRPETIARLEAMASSMCVDLDTLAEAIVLDALPSPHHEDLIGPPVEAHEEMN